MQYRDYYKRLGVARDATQGEIKKAYRKLARTHHPDLNKDPDAESRFKEISEAYEVLKDTEKRAAYDQLGAEFETGQTFRPPPNWDAGFEFSGGAADGDMAGFSDFFETLFGRSQAGHSAQSAGFQSKGQDHHAKVLIDIEDAYHGATRRISLGVPTLDDDGRVRMHERRLDVRIPIGIQRGQHIRLVGQGGPGIGGGPAGDLYVEIDFRPDSRYRADGADIYLDLPVAPWETALGAKVRVPTPEGFVDLSVPAGSRQGQKLRLKGKGLPGQSPGDLYVVLQIVLPPATDDASRQVYRDMAEKLPFNPRSNLEV